jgi:hypothetical protein
MMFSAGKKRMGDCGYWLIFQNTRNLVGVHAYKNRGHKMETMAAKYQMMMEAKDERVALLIHNACNMAMIHMAQVGGHVRRIWEIGKN